MSDEQLVLRFMDVLAHGDLGVLDELLDPACDDRNPVLLQSPGRAGVAWKFTFHAALYPKARTELTTLVCEAPGMVWASWSTELAPGTPPERYVGRFSIRAGKIAAFEVEHVAAG